MIMITLTTTLTTKKFTYLYVTFKFVDMLLLYAIK